MACPDFIKAFVGNEYYSNDECYMTIGYGTIGKHSNGYLEIKFRNRIINNRCE